jgi:hypothetical protein
MSSDICEAINMQFGSIKTSIEFVLWMLVLTNGCEGLVILYGVNSFANVMMSSKCYVNVNNADALCIQIMLHLKIFIELNRSDDGMNFANLYHS